MTDTQQQGQALASAAFVTIDQVGSKHAHSSQRLERDKKAHRSACGGRQRGLGRAAFLGAFEGQGHVLVGILDARKFLAGAFRTLDRIFQL